MDRVFRYRRGTHLRIGDRNRTSRANAGLAAIGDASVDCAVVRFGTDGHRIRATFAQLPAAVHYLHYHHLRAGLARVGIEIFAHHHCRSSLGIQCRNHQQCAQYAAIAVIAFSWAKDDDTGNTDNTKL